MQIDKLPNQLLHGGDYNPDQWLDMPEILVEDIRLMKEANINCMTLGVFSWSRLEPQESDFQFDYMENIINELYNNGIYTILATPTGAMPRWLTDNYEEVNRVGENGIRRIHGFRHNFCPSSKKMRQAMYEINTAMVKRFGKHPGIIAWHVSNEYGGGAEDCHCPQCQQAFRDWLKNRYKTIDAINHAWWSDFWGNRIQSWEEIHSPVSSGENGMNGLLLDWRRFVSDQMIDFAREEVNVIKQYSQIPCTANLMGAFRTIDYFKLAKEFDFVSLDCYPFWNVDDGAGKMASFNHSLTRSLKKQSFLLMESVPSAVQWMPRCTLKRPGMHELSSLQAIANGSNSVQYFQWRKGRGSSEKYHGAVIDHKNSGNTRVYRDVQRLGERLEDIAERVLATVNKPKVALIYDWENMWALENCGALLNPFNGMKKWFPYFEAFTQLGVDVDIVDMTDSLEGYSLVIAPVNYMYRGNYIETVKTYVHNGGIYVTTYFSGEVDASDLCFIGEHPLRDVLGIRTEEIDVRPENMDNHIIYGNSNYPIIDLCAIVHTERAETLATYEKDYYEGYPALTKNHFGKGAAYFFAAEGCVEYITEVYKQILDEIDIAGNFTGRLLDGVMINTRVGEKEKLYFLQNYSDQKKTIDFSGEYTNIETGEVYNAKIMHAKINILPYQCLVLSEEIK